MSLPSKKTQLELIEDEIHSTAFEAFYIVGQKLSEIRTKRLYEHAPANCKSWAEYCRSGRIDFTKRQADNYIRASLLRPKLGTNGSHDWTERQLRELCKCQTDRDAQRVAKKAIKQAEKKGVRITAKLLKQLVENDNGTTSRKREEAERRSNELWQASSIDAHLEKLGGDVFVWLHSLKEIPNDTWLDASDHHLDYAIEQFSELQKLLTRARATIGSIRGGGE